MSQNDANNVFPGSADIIESLVLLFKKSISRDQIYQVKGKGKDGKLTKSVGIPGMPLATLIANLVDQTQPAEGCTATNPDKTMVYYSRPFRPSNADFLPEFEQSQAPESAYREHITGVRATAYQELSAVGADRSRIVSDSGPRREAPRLGPWRASIAVLSHHGVAKPPCAICQCSIDLDATLHPKFRTSDAENKTALEGNLNNGLCVEGRFLVAVSDLGSA